MAKFSASSLQRLETCDERLQRLFHIIVHYFDCTILEGHRTKEKQNQAYREGRSQLQWPNGKHNKIPSIAVDVIPYPIDWGDRERMSYFAGFVKGIAVSMNIKVRWGGDWDSDTEVKDNSFDDLVHFELVP